MHHVIVQCSIFRVIVDDCEIAAARFAVFLGLTEGVDLCCLIGVVGVAIVKQCVVGGNIHFGSSFNRCIDEGVAVFCACVESYIDLFIYRLIAVDFGCFYCDGITVRAGRGRAAKDSSFLIGPCDDIGDCFRGISVFCFCRFVRVNGGRVFCRCLRCRAG